MHIHIACISRFSDGCAREKRGILSMFWFEVSAISQSCALLLRSTCIFGHGVPKSLKNLGKGTVCQITAWQLK